MTDLQKLNVKDFIDRLIYLAAQINAARKFSPIRLIGDEDEVHVHIDKRADFEDIMDLYKIDESEVKIICTDTPCTVYLAHFRGLCISYTALKDDEGFKEDKDV